MPHVFQEWNTERPKSSQYYKALLSNTSVERYVCVYVLNSPSWCIYHFHYMDVDHKDHSHKTASVLRIARNSLLNPHWLSNWARVSLLQVSVWASEAILVLLYVTTNCKSKTNKWLLTEEYWLHWGFLFTNASIEQDVCRRKIIIECPFVT